MKLGIRHGPATFKKYHDHNPILQYQWKEIEILYSLFVGISQLIQFSLQQLCGGFRKGCEVGEYSP